MIRRHLLPVVLTAAVLLVTVNLAIIAWSHRLPYAKKLEVIRSARDPNLLLIGNSLLDGHVDEEALVAEAAAHGAVFRPLNGALGAALPPEQRLLFEYATRIHPSIRTVVVGFFDFQLTLEDHSRVLDLTGNRMVGIDRRFPVSQVSAAYQFGTIEAIQVALLQHLPMIANRANVWKYVELSRRTMGEMGMPHAATNNMGRVDDFASLEMASSREFTDGTNAFLRHPDHFNTSFESILSQARRSGMEVVIVLMPMSPYHRAEYYSQPVWGQYRASLFRLAQQRGIWSIDASEWVEGERNFADHLHMSSSGVHEFSVRLGDELSGGDQTRESVSVSRP